MKRTFFSALVTGVTLGCAVQAQTTFPTDVDQTACPVDSTMLNSWFASGTAETGGWVKPADSLTFPAVDNTACDFYRWGAQMFLWITSPDGNTIVLDTDQFLDVVETSNGFAYEDNSGADTPNNFVIRDRKPDSIGGTGQAGGADVLVSQGNSLTYYGIHTNDIYASYLKGQKAGAFAGTSIAENFPTSEADMQLIQDYVDAPLRDPDAMTMELKTSWVDASTVSDASQFVTISATVPTFDTTQESNWPMTGTEQMTLALVGMHIAAPVNGHPELVWSSFEHISAAPMASYYYLNTSGAPTQKDFDMAGNWVFSPSQPTVLSVASWDSSDSAIKAAGTIRAVPVAQINPWGLAPSDSANAAANSDLVNLNENVLGALQGLNDVRGYYLQIGGIWTVEGQLPTGANDTNIRGGTRLANATMETFHQYPDVNNGFQSKNCFFCHSTSGTSGLALSHIFSGLAPQ